MGCQNDYLAPNARETYTRETAQLICYAAGSLNQPVEQWIRDAAQSQYGAPHHDHQLTETLCTLCGSMTKEQQDKIIYDGRDSEARKLANWWENHQKEDARRGADEAHAARMTEIATKIIGVLGDEQKEALRFAVKNNLI